MEYYNSLLENAVIEVLERHKDEIMGEFYVNISYADLAKAMQEQSLDLLKEIFNYIENSSDDDSLKIERITSMLLDSGIN